MNPMRPQQLAPPRPPHPFNLGNFLIVLIIVLLAMDIRSNFLRYLTAYALFFGIAMPYVIITSLYHRATSRIPFLNRD